MKTPDSQTALPAPFFRAQHGEDRALLEFFGGKPGFYVDVGANDGLSNSNTAALEEMGWRGILVEADPELAEMCRASRPHSDVVSCAAANPATQGEEASFLRVSPGYDKSTGLSTLFDSPEFRRKAEQAGAKISTITVPVRSLNDILKQHHAPACFELLSVDVEGGELEVFRSLDLNRWRPRIIIAEDNSAGDNHSVQRHLRRFGFHLAWRTGVNDWYVRRFDLHRFAGRRLRLELLRWRQRIERSTTTLERFFAGKETGYFVQLGLEIGASPGRSAVLERDGWRGLLVEMDEQKALLATKTRKHLQVVSFTIGPSEAEAASRAWLVNESDWQGFSPHAQAIPRAITPPAGAVPCKLPVYPLTQVVEENNAPAEIELLAIGSDFDAGDVLASADLRRFRPRLVLIDNRSPGQDAARDRLQSAGWRQVHWAAMSFWYAQSIDLPGFRRERLLLCARSFLWFLKRYLHWSR